MCLKWFLALEIHKIATKILILGAIEKKLADQTMGWRPSWILGSEDFFDKVSQIVTFLVLFQKDKWSFSLKPVVCQIMWLKLVYSPK